MTRRHKNGMIFPALRGIRDEVFVSLIIMAACAGCPRQDPPTADFTAAPIAGRAPLEVHFTDLSDPGSGTITAWLWNFGDGDTSGLAQPTHTYVEPGRFSILLQVATEYGNDSEFKPAYVSIGAGEGEGENTLTIGDVRGSPGAPVSVPVTFDAAQEEVATILFQLDYDPAKLRYEGSATGPAAAGKTVQVNRPSEAMLRIAVFGGAASLPDGVLLFVSFTPAAGTAGQIAVLDGLDGSAADPNAARINLVVVDGAVRVH